MFTPAVNRVSDTTEVHDLIEAARFGHIVSFGRDGFDATGLPLLVDREAGSGGTLRGHFARANKQWKQLNGVDVLVIFPLADGYVSPAHYPSKAENGRVVPTWNYEVIHARGTARIHDDATWVRQLVTDLTARHESSRTDLATAPMWAVTDAPEDFVERQLRAIVGVEIEITSLDAKRKLSQNRSDEDRLEVIAANDASPQLGDHGLAIAMRSTGNWSGADPHDAAGGSS